MEQFVGTIESALGGGAFVAVPAAVSAALGGGRVPVRATFDGIEYRGSIVDMGSGPCLGVLKAIRTQLGKGPGDTVLVTVVRDDAERTVEVPDDLAAALHAAGLRAAFDELSYSRRREHVTSVVDAKREDTRSRRIAKVVAELR
ncbi:YdeI/OmpD-associated family protein [Nocardia brasiliensis]|uniref:YdeI/OmpD-associated family protein n=1 Tax=Nocardia brasiliensis TaxID=37326 RepID=UPI002457C6D9|nr:YdeI/OmpD-associated family protein [Nocardia brasiliensis]